MKPCPRFHRIKALAERDAATHTSHAKRHTGKPSAKVSATLAVEARHSMAKALSRHYQNCPECA
jgi:hypothetical protein